MARVKTVGIKELKDQASAIVESVQRTGKPVTVTKNNREVARIVPITPAREEFDLEVHFRQLGWLVKPAQGKLSDLILEPTGLDSRAAIAAILEDRESE